MYFKKNTSKFFQSLIALSFLLMANGLSGQEIKVEKEERVREVEVPAQSTGWLSEVFPSLSKVKWYKESTSGKTSYEAKFKYQSKKYSVEFSETGAFEDIEFLVNWKSLDENLRDRLINLLTGFEKIKVRKVQKQWTGDNKEILKDAIQNSKPKGIIERYELVFQAKKGGKYHIWEALLSETKLISLLEVRLRSTANLDF